MTVPLLERTTCPHCWHAFATEDVLWVATHGDLRGDDRLTGEAFHRFLPSRFTVAGDAVDPLGLPCTDLACPNCHLNIPRAALEMEPYFVSILGTPYSGKSYFLAAMTWELNRHLPEHFAVNFSNAAPADNLTLTDYEQSLFMNPDGETPQPLFQLIQKTQSNRPGHFDHVAYGNFAVQYPRPFLFGLKPSSRHVNVGDAERISRLLCFYDIAGEQCLPGADSFADAATRHLAKSNLLMFVFDPLQDPRFRAKALGGSGDGFAKAGRTARQENVLHEMASRVRRFTGLGQNAKHDRPLVVVVTKSDAWANLVPGVDVFKEPWIRNAQTKVAVVNAARVEEASYAVRQLLEKYCPEIVRVAEDFADPLYVPVTALGQQPKPDPATKEPAIRPVDIKPRWVTVPLMAGAGDGLRSLIFRVRKGG
jgi:hypothetical protein